MDPVSLVLMFVGWMLGVFLYRGTKHALTTPKDAGNIAISAGENYDMRWGDPEYVKLIHKTMAGEETEFGTIYTDCECPQHKVAKVLPKAETTTPGPAVKYNRFVVDGYIFNIRDDKVPANAYGEWDARMQYGVFRWVDSKTGKMMMMKALPTLDIEADYIEIHSDQHVKPVKTIVNVKPKRDIGSDHGTVIRGNSITAGTIRTGNVILTPDEPKTHIMFTNEGPVKMTETEMRKTLREVRERDRKRRGTSSLGPM